MKRTELESGHIHSIGYEEDTFTLEIQFRKKDGSPGPVYQYNPITKQGYKLLMNSSSKGSFFEKNIKFDKSIKCTKVDAINRL